MVPTQTQRNAEDRKNILKGNWKVRSHKWYQNSSDKLQHYCEMICNLSCFNAFNYVKERQQKTGGGTQF